VSVSATYSIEVKIVGGPSILKTGAINTDAYDIVTTKVPKGSAPVSLDVQPGGTGKVQAIIMSSDNYESLSYTVDEGSSQTFDAPVVILGPGEAKLLGTTQKVFEFVNAGSTNDANVTILVLREAESASGA